MNEKKIIYYQKLLNKTLGKKKKKVKLFDGDIKIICDTNTVISVIEPILFSLYGKEQIEKQRPYEIYYIDNYWIVSGTINTLGGVFLVFVNSYNGEFIKISHGK